MKKRGFIIAVVLFLLVVGLVIGAEGDDSIDEFSEGENEPSASSSSSSSGSSSNDCTSNLECSEGQRCEENNCVDFVVNEETGLYVHTKGRELSLKKGPEKSADCNMDIRVVPDENGCYLVDIQDHNSLGNSDTDVDIAVINIAEVVNLLENKLSYVSVNPIKFAKGGSSILGRDQCLTGSKAGSGITTEEYFSEGQTSYVCSNDKYWHVCNADNDGTYTWGANQVFKCELKDNHYSWVAKGTDADGDGFSPSNDCDDNFDDDPLYCNEIKSVEQCDDFDIDKKGQCAICVNPATAEIAGDGVDNDCSQLIPGDDRTPDEVNLFKEGCEMSGLKGDENQEFPITQLNVRDESFSWVNTPEGGFCCGFNGLEDLGKSFGNVDEGSREEICLNSRFVKSANEISGCDDGWCFISATEPNIKFKVMTVNSPDSTFDIVSDNNEWHVCKEGEGEFISTTGLVEDKKVANRFICYQEGEKYAFAECGAEQSELEFSMENKDTIKGRYAGEGLYSIYIGGENGVISGSEFEFDVEDGGLTSYYSDEFNDISFDFRGYEFMELMVKFNIDENQIFDDDGNEISREPNFDDLTLPLYVRVTFLDDEGQELFNEEALSYITNSFSFSSWMHVKMPIASINGIKRIRFETNQNNDISIRNIFVSNGDSKICSGIDSRERSNWLDELDYDDDEVINGEKLCNNLFGNGDLDPAWIGNQCCGDDLNEYISDGFKMGDQFTACWNSVSIKSSERISNVNFDVESGDVEYVVEEEESSGVPLSLHQVNAIDMDDLIIEVADSSNTRRQDDEIPRPFEILSLDHEEQDLRMIINIELRDLSDNEIREYTLIIPSERFIRLNPETGSQYVLEEPFRKPVSELIGGGDISIIDENIWANEGHLRELYRFHVEYSKRMSRLILANENAYFFNTNTGDIKNELNKDDLDNVDQFIVKSNKDKEYSVTTQETKSTKQLSYACQEEECIFPLVGSAPYVITNPYPDLYELYFISESDPDNHVLIEGVGEFREFGNVVAKRVSKSIVFIKTDEGVVDEGEEEDNALELNGVFYGCQAPLFIENDLNLANSDFENLNHCSTKANFYCAFNEFKGEGRDRFSLVNSWSSDGILQTGYADMEEGQANLRTLRDNDPHEANMRNISSSAVFGRNILSNFEFSTSGQNELPYWNVFEGNVRVENERNLVNEEVGILFNEVNLGVGQIMRSEKIAVIGGVNMHFSQEGNCEVNIYLIDKDGDSLEVGDTNSFLTGNANNLVVEFVGACSISKPNLQVIDLTGPSEFTLEDSPITSEALPRAAASCCPRDYCWNGFTCVNGLEQSTEFSENTGDGKDYRCVEGSWVNTPRKFDWDYLKSGFCNNEEQCFVRGSVDQGSYENTVEDYYEGNSPACIENGEYIFDNYCEQGDWVSRTKFAAQTLLDASEGNFVLYCDNQERALPNIGTHRNLIDGAIPTAAQSPEVAEGLDVAMGDGQEAEPVVAPSGDIDYKCFDIGSDFVRDVDNNCINNVCILKQDEDITIATSVNNDIDMEKSFLLTLGVDVDDLDTACPIEDGPSGFVECQVEVGSLFYNNATGVVIYNRDGFSLGGGAIDNFVDFMKEFLGIEGEEEDDKISFIANAGNMKKAYVTDDVRSIQSFINGSEELVAEFVNFDTPVCEFLKNKDVGLELETEALEEASGFNKMSCVVDGEIQVIKAKARRGSTDDLWPMVSGRLRRER